MGKARIDKKAEGGKDQAAKDKLKEEAAPAIIADEVCTAMETYLKEQEQKENQKTKEQKKQDAEKKAAEKKKTRRCREGSQRKMQKERRWLFGTGQSVLLLVAYLLYCVL